MSTLAKNRTYLAVFNDARKRLCSMARKLWHTRAITIPKLGLRIYGSNIYYCRQSMKESQFNRIVKTMLIILSKNVI